MDLFEHLGSFLERLGIYTTIQLTPIMTGIIVKIMAELLSVLALATKQIKEKRFSKCTAAYNITYCVAQRPTEKFAKKLLGESEIEDVLQRLNQLTQEEARIAGAETLCLVHGLVGNVKLIMEGVRCLDDVLSSFSLTLACFYQTVRHQWTGFDGIRVCVSRKIGITPADLRLKPLFSNC